MFIRILLLFVLISCATLGKAEAVYTNTVKVVIPYGPGGGPDRIFRTLQEYGQRNNINFVAEYKPGADSLIGSRHFLSYDKNNKTLMLTILSDIQNLISAGKIEEGSMTAISHIAMSRIDIAARSGFPADNLEQLMYMVKTDPQSVTWVMGSKSQEYYLETIAERLGINKAELISVKFPNLPAGIATVAGGNADLLVGPAALFDQLYQSNRLKLLGTVKPEDSVNPDQKSLEEIFGKLNQDGFVLVGLDSQSANHWRPIIDDYKQCPVVLQHFKSNFMKPGLKTVSLTNKHATNKIKTSFDLTFRQDQIARLIFRNGLSSRQIAQQLKIKESTVKLHTTILFKKFGVQNRTQLVSAMAYFG